MRDQWVGDLRDYMKYFILRKLAEHTPVRVCWMLWEEENVRYLFSPDVREKYREIDCELHERLVEIVGKSTRTTEVVECKVFDQCNVQFFRAPFGGTRERRGTREGRKKWVLSLLHEAKTDELLFFDPDTGLQPKAGGDRKHLRWDEIAIVTGGCGGPCAAGGRHSLAVYHHLRNPDKDLKCALTSLREHVPEEFEVFALRSREVDAAFLIAARLGDRDNLRKGAESARKDWNGGSGGREIRPLECVRP